MKTDLYVLRLQFIPGPPSALAVPLPGPLPVPLPDLAYVNGPGRGVARDARCQCQTTVSPSLRQLQAAPPCHAYSAAELPPAVRDAAKSLAIWLDDVASLFAFVFLLIFYQRFSCSCCSSYCCCCCCGWTYLKTFNSARWVVVSSVGVAPDSFLIYLSPLSPAEKLLCIVLACCSCCCRLLTNYAWKCCGQHAACRGKRHARQGGGGRGRGRGRGLSVHLSGDRRSGQVNFINLIYTVHRRRNSYFSQHLYTL